MSKIAVNISLLVKFSSNKSIASSNCFLFWNNILTSCTSFQFSPLKLLFLINSFHNSGTIGATINPVEAPVLVKFGVDTKSVS